MANVTLEKIEKVYPNGFHAVHELVRSKGYDRSASEIWEGSATLELFPAPNEEHTALAPVRVGKGFRFTLGYSVDDLETLEQL